MTTSRRSIQPTGCTETVRVVLDVRISEGTWGGVQQAAMGLAHGLSRLADGRERYYFVGYVGEMDWLQPVLGHNGDVIEIEKPVALWSRLANRVQPSRTSSLGVPMIEANDRGPAKIVSALGAQIVHFTHQAAFRTSARQIYQPHDLQHLHLPQFFTRQAAKRRNDLYLARCRRADMIAVMSRWGRADLLRQYHVDERKVFVIPWAAPVEAYRPPTVTDLHRIRVKYGLPAHYLLYPAQTWPHKNHVRLLRAIREAVDHGARDIALVCTGHQGSYLESVAAEARDLDLTDRIRFLGWVPTSDMIGIYRLARAMIYPSLFEGWGMPIMESFRLGVPVACSRIPVLEEQAGDAAIYFDPQETSGIASVISSLWENVELRDRLVNFGRRRAQAIDWETVARAFRAHYRRLAGASLDVWDTQLVSRSASGEWLP